MDNNISGQKPNLAVSVMAKYRQTAQKYGPFFGQQLFTIVAQSPDLKWKEDVMANKNTLRQEVKAYLLKAIDVKSVALLERDIDNRPKIVLNEKDNDPALVFELADPDFTKATRESIREAIDRLGKPGSKPMFFTAEELPMLNELLKLPNQSVLTFYEDLARKYMQLAETVRGYMEMNERMQIEYMQQCGIQPNTDVQVEVHTTVE